MTVYDKLSCGLKMAEEPLILEEQELIFKYAKEYDEKLGGWCGISVYKTILFLLDTGIHPASARPGNVKVKRSRVGDQIVWNRTKKEGLDAVTAIPMPESLDSWVEEFVKTDLLTNRRYYWDMCKALRDYIQQQMGEDMPEFIKQLGPRQLRHTFGVNRIAGIRGKKCDPYEVKAWMNCSWKTMEYYLRRARATERKW